MGGHYVVIRRIATFRKEKQQKKLSDKNVLLMTHCASDGRKMVSDKREKLKNRQG